MRWRYRVDEAPNPETGLRAVQDSLGRMSVRFLTKLMAVAAVRLRG